MIVDLVVGIMKKSTVFIFFVVLFLLNIKAVPAAQTVEFSADVAVTEGQGKQARTRGRLYVGRSGIRSEVYSKTRSMVLIFRPDKQLVVQIFPKKRLFTEHSGPIPPFPPLPGSKESPCITDKTYRCRNMGSEMINGRQMSKWEIVTVQDKTMSQPIYYWVDRRIQLVVQESYPGGFINQLNNIREAPQPNNLFTIPAGYRKIDQTQNPSQRPSTPGR